jgi:hypothetical protein
VTILSCIVKRPKYLFSTIGRFLWSFNATKSCGADGTRTSGKHGVSQLSADLLKVNSDSPSSKTSEIPYFHNNGPESGPDQNASVDPVEAALANAITQAVASGKFDIVAQLCRELEARRLARSRATNILKPARLPRTTLLRNQTDLLSSNVVKLDSRRSKG